jgi:hypothetical protein
MLEKSKRFGCPKCGNDGRDARFREINLALVDNFFQAFSTLPCREGCVDEYTDHETDFEGAKPLARGAYQCLNCDAYFDIPAELPDSVQDGRNPEGEPLRPDLLVLESEVVWSVELPATVVFDVKGGDPQPSVQQRPHPSRDHSRNGSLPSRPWRSSQRNHRPCRR